MERGGRVGEGEIRRWGGVDRGGGEGDGERERRG